MTHRSELPGVDYQEWTTQRSRTRNGRNAMSGDDGGRGSGDVSFTDQPEEPGTEKRAPESADESAAHTGERTEAGEQTDAGGRTEAGTGSTGPTTMREDLGTLAEEGRKLLAAVETRFVGPLVRSYPEVARHLGAASREIAEAYRSAVHGQERAWREPRGADRQQEKITVERVDSVEPPESGNPKD
jgi:hypothetical protein